LLASWVSERGECCTLVCVASPPSWAVVVVG
jgi:hypothetical protein